MINNHTGFAIEIGRVAVPVDTAHQHVLTINNHPFIMDFIDIAGREISTSRLQRDMFGSPDAVDQCRHLIIVFFFFNIIPE